MFSTLYATYFSFQMNFKMFSAICLNLDQSKILWTGNALTDLLQRGNEYNMQNLAILWQNSSPLTL